MGSGRRIAASVRKRAAFRLAALLGKALKSSTA
jgi:hypothetical protein